MTNNRTFHSLRYVFIAACIAFCVNSCRTDEVIEVDIKKASVVVLEPFTQALYNLTFVDSMRGMLIMNRRVYRTTDGGLTWSISYTPVTNAYVDKIRYVTPTQAYFVYYSNSSAFGRMYSSSNGGSSWQPQFQFGGASLTPAFYSATSGYAYGRVPSGSYGFHSTVDGGATYTYLYPCSVLGPQMYFTNSQTGYAIMDSEAFAKTSNAGQTWTATFHGCRKFTEVTPVGTCYLINDQFKIYKSTDFGTTWNLCFEDPGVDYLRDIVCLDNGLVVVSADEKLLCSRDGGVSWSYLSLDENVQYLDDLYIRNNTTVIARSSVTNTVVRISIPADL